MGLWSLPYTTLQLRFVSRPENIKHYPPAGEALLTSSYLPVGPRRSTETTQYETNTAHGRETQSLLCRPIATVRLTVERELHFKTTEGRPKQKKEQGKAPQSTAPPKA